jgi:hypothetical protein
MTTPISRGPDGRHLDADGVATLNKFFEEGGTAYGATKKFGLSYGGARERFVKWRSERSAPKPKVFITPDERRVLAAALPIIQKILNATA